MKSSYKGDSPPKKVARFLVHRWMQKNTDVTERNQAKYLVLPSREAGDLSVLTAMRVPEENIYAIDVDKEAIAYARHRFPRAHFARAPFWEALDAFPELRNGIHFAHIDLCGPIRQRSNTKHFLSLSSHCKLLGYTFECGREQNEDLRAVNLVPDDVVRSRVKYLHLLDKRKRHFRCERVIHYLSSATSNNRKHMVTVLGRLTTKRALPCITEEVDIDWYTLRKIVLEVPTKVAAGWFNIPTTTIAAWRAHETRGTYAK